MQEDRPEVTFMSLRREQTSIYKSPEADEILDEWFLTGVNEYQSERISSTLLSLEVEDYIASDEDLEAMRSFTPAYGPAISLKEDYNDCEENPCGLCDPDRSFVHIGATHISRVDLDDLVYRAQIKASRLLMQDVERLMN